MNETTKTASAMLAEIGDQLLTYAPAVLKVLAVAIVGWIIALIIRAATRRILGLINANELAAKVAGTKVDLESGVSRVVYFLVMLVVLIAIAGAIEVDAIGGPIQALVNPVYAFLPKLVGAGVLAVAAWVLANLARTVVTRLLSKTQVDEKLTEAAGVRPISETIGVVLHGGILLLFLPLILGTLELDSLLVPVQEMIGTLLSYVPNILAALIVGFIGWVVARVLRDVVTALTTSLGGEELSKKLNLPENAELPKVLGVVVQAFVLVPAVVVALQVLEIEAITGPATRMLETMIDAVPQIVAAALILAIAVAVAKLISPVVVNVLAATGFDKLPGMLGLEEHMEGRKVSDLGGKLFYLAVVLFAAVEAAARLGFGEMTELLAMFIRFGGDILLGATILVVGLLLANLAFRVVSKAGGEGAGVLAQLTRVAIIGLVLAMGLGAMGVAEQIVTLAFTMTIGGVAVAFALAFGLGGREAAGRFLQKQLDRFESR